MCTLTLVQGVSGDFCTSTNVLMKIVRVFVSLETLQI